MAKHMYIQTCLTDNDGFYQRIIVKKTKNRTSICCKPAVYPTFHMWSPRPALQTSASLRPPPSDTSSRISLPVTKTPALSWKFGVNIAVSGVSSVVLWLQECFLCLFRHVWQDECMCFKLKSFFPPQSSTRKMCVNPVKFITQLSLKWFSERQL